MLRSRFAAVRVRAAHRDYWRTHPHDQQWLLIEWPKGAAEPTKYWLANLAATTRLKELVRLAKLRWRIERDFQELKQELGLNHFEGRSWRGFHHHATLCIAAYGFLVAERCAFSPTGPCRHASLSPPRHFRPRGAPDNAAAPGACLNCHSASAPRPAAAARAAALPLLPAPADHSCCAIFITQ